MPRAKNEYTAVAGAEKRLREILAAQYVEPDLIDGLVAALTGEATIEHKPRLKAIVITIPIPEPAPEPKLGKFVPVEPRDDAHPGEEDDRPSRLSVTRVWTGADAVGAEPKGNSCHEQ